MRYRNNWWCSAVTVEYRGTGWALGWAEARGALGSIHSFLSASAVWQLLLCSEPLRSIFLLNYP